MHNDQLTTDQRSDRVTSSTAIESTAEAVFAVLADPRPMPTSTAPAGCDGTVDGDRLTETGQVFRMAMYHENHPDKDYEMANLIEVFDEPHAIAWKPGQEDPATGELGFGGWLWRYDLEAPDRHRRR